MEARAFQALELNRVLAYLAGFSVSEAGFQACLGLRPLSDVRDVRREADLFEQGRLFVLRTDTRLLPFPTLDGLLQFLLSPSATLDLDDLFALRGLLAQGKEKAEAMLADPAARESGGWPLWAERSEMLPQPVKSLAALTRCLSDDGLIKDEASPELSLVRGELRRLHQQCARKVKDYAAEYNILHYLQDTFMTLSSDRYVLPLKTNFKGRLQGVIHDYSQTGETCYFEPLFLVELNNRLQELKREEREEERKILLYLSGLAREELPGIRAVYEFLLELDLLFARAALADCYDGRMVEFTEGRGIVLREARHPLLALAASGTAAKALRQHDLRKAALAGQSVSGEEDGASAENASGRMRAKVVASTLELLPGQQALVISGGNAGGKTVCLKTLGLISLMGLCALPVPVEPGSVLPPWRNIHAFIGDEQSLDDQVSTFTAQITHLGRIWPMLGPDALVILDEFGAGTDPTQGAALAQAVVDSLMESGSFVVAATHFPALKAYALSTQGVRAASVLFDPKTKKPLFRLVYDQVGASQALDVAREHGLPEPVLRRAEQYLLLSGEDSSALVERLNALAVEREVELAVLGKEKASFAEKRRKLEERFEAERTRLFESVQAEARKVLSDWKASRVSHKQALKELSRIRGTLLAAPAVSGSENAPGTRAGVDMAALVPRSRVRHIPWNRTGVLLEVDERKKRVRIDFDGVSLWADIADIELPDAGNRSTGSGGKNGPGSGTSGGVVNNAGISAPVLPLRLDLRGLRADVAVSELEKFLDGAIISGRDEVEIIHGRGTGVLRREIHGFLKNFPAVRDYRLAPEDQGGDGMTIVELK
ncbi:MAG: Smr/MutS family protein [Desulfovibrionaceae bacterium]|nr:Smr/MutS family protein [Desulfovibrionaceae bacterium]